jgi:hypothetical protein
LKIKLIAWEQGTLPLLIITIGTSPCGEVYNVDLAIKTGLDDATGPTLLRANLGDVPLSGTSPLLHY